MTSDPPELPTPPSEAMTEPSDVEDDALFLDNYDEALRAGSAITPEQWLREHPALPERLRAGFEELYWAHDHVPPPTIRDFEIQEELGRGGMSVVYKACQREPRRIVAVKLCLPGSQDARLQHERFRREAQAVADLEHTNIVPIHTVGSSEDQPYFVMKFMAGGSLARRPDAPAGGLPPAEAAELVRTIASAVHYAHVRGILHRDLKPSNILLDDQRRPYVCDFGLARWLTRASDLTPSLCAVGTPRYAAPEQAAGALSTITIATDVYGLGTILYELLTGCPPFDAETDALAWEQVLTKDPKRPRSVNSRVPAELETICLKCLEKDPARRYSSAEALAEDLRCWLAGEPIHARRMRTWERAWRWMRRRPLATALLALCLVTALVGALVFVWQYEKAQMARDEAERHVYFSLIAQARLEWLAGDVARAEQLLSHGAPEPGQEDRRGWEWFYLKRLCRAELQTYDTGGRWIYCVAYSPDDRYLIAAGGNPFTETKQSVLKVWDLASGSERNLSGDGQGLVGACFTPDGERLIAAGTRLEALRGYVPSELCAWDVRSGRELLRASVRVDRARCMALSPDGHQAAVGGRDANIVVLDVRTGQVLFVLATEREHVLGLAFHPSKPWLASVTQAEQRFSGRVQDCKTQVWDLTHPGEILFSWPASPGAVAYSPDGALLATPGTEDAIVLRKADDGGQASVLTGHTGHVWSAAFTRDGRKLATASADWTVRLWDVPSGAHLLTLRGHNGGVRSVAYRSDGAQLASGSQDGSLKLWNPNRNRQGLLLSGEGKFPTALAFLSDGGELASAYLDTPTLRTWNARTGERLADKPIEPLTFLDWPCAQAVFSADGRLFASLVGEGARAVGIWDTASGNLVQTLRGHTSRIRSLAFSPDNQRLASAASEGDKRPYGPAEGRIWEIATGQERATFCGPEAAVGALAFSSDGGQLAGACLDGTVRFWDSGTGREVMVRHGHEIAASSVAYSADGRQLASTGYLDRTICLWDLPSGRLVRTLKAPSQLTGVCFSPDGRRLAAVSLDSVRLWDVASGQEAFTLPNLTRHRDEDLAFNARVVFSPDGNYLAASNWDGTISVWDASPLNPE